MGRLGSILAIAGVLLSLVGCAAGEPPATTGVLAIDAAFVAPPPGAPMSIGGYAAFARLVGPGDEVIYEGEVNPMTRVNVPRPSAQLFELAAGDYGLEISVRPASDAIMVDQNGVIQREFGPISATCTGAVSISPSDVLALTVTLVGGQACSIALAE